MRISRLCVPAFKDTLGQLNTCYAPHGGGVVFNLEFISGDTVFFPQKDRNPLFYTFRE